MIDKYNKIKVIHILIHRKLKVIHRYLTYILLIKQCQ